MNRLETIFFTQTLFSKRFVHSYHDALKNCRQYMNDFFFQKEFMYFLFLLIVVNDFLVWGHLSINYVAAYGVRGFMQMSTLLFTL